MIKTNKGFTLIETIISILLLTIVLAASIRFYFNSTDIMAKAMRKKVAMEMAGEAMEQIKIAGYYTPSLSTVGWVDVPLTGWDTSNIFPTTFSLHREKQITNDTGGASPNKKVEIQVRWFEPGNPTEIKLSLATYLSQ